MMFIAERTPLVLWAEDGLGKAIGKTATGVIRFGRWPVVAVIDSTQAGKSVRQVTGLDCDAPVVPCLADALSQTLKPVALMLGTAPQGGELPPDGRLIVIEALQAGLHLINGLHHFLQDDVELAKLAQQKHVILWDVRRWTGQQRVTRQMPRPLGKQVITLVGSDCSVGKMFSALSLHHASLVKGLRSAFLATGQTGILISGQGVPLDSLVGDFMAGAIEAALLPLLDDADQVWVEGQGSLLHPAYSGVTMALLHGSLPDALVLCHHASLTHIRHYQVPIPPLSDLIALYEQAASWARPPDRPNPRVKGLCVNTSALPDEEAQAWLAAARAETGLPCTDPVRYGVSELLATAFDNMPA